MPDLPPLPPVEAYTDATPSRARVGGVSLVRASDVVERPIHWLWPGWLARGKLIILAGAAGTGKTTLALGLAATVTTGGVLA
ncbi:AAA family ATPase [Achromobacter ruhlandii]|uniref:AAA family ATPase n=1 Tax=Achromobacter ruhlandii TaxID=72557 RepID=UPI0022B882DF|nr:AAA family ATPase [Achromobacter ruhlandii]MCZ8395885.1 AAA family ATPase [Achromobacter ruhlandii]